MFLSLPVLNKSPSKKLKNYKIFQVKFFNKLSNIVKLVDLEMSKMTSSSQDEDSCCESDDNYAIKDTVEPIKREENVRQRNSNQINLKPNSTEQVHQQSREQRSDQFNNDETESNLNFEEQPAYTSTPSTSPISLITQEKMRRRLQFFFMNPIEKWQAKRR